MQTSLTREYGPHRRPMGGARSVVSPPATGRWPEPTVAEHARGVEPRAVDSTHWRSLARFARSLSALPDLSSTFSAVAALRAAHALGAETGRGLTRSRHARSERSVHRRQLQRREKGGSSVGPTKRGKGSKIVAIADRHGLPIAVHVASARPNEAILVEAPLEQRFLPEAPARLIGDKAYDSDPLDQRLRESLAAELLNSTGDLASAGEVNALGNVVKLRAASLSTARTRSLSATSPSCCSAPSTAWKGSWKQRTMKSSWRNSTETLPKCGPTSLATDPQEPRNLLRSPRTIRPRYQGTLQAPASQHAPSNTPTSTESGTPQPPRDYYSVRA
jgi:hypothetical protein